MAGTTSGEQHHVGHALLKPGSILGQHQDRAGRSVANDADAWPHIDGPGYAVAAGGNEDDAFAGALLNLVDGLLEGRAIVGAAVGPDRKLIGREIDRGGVVEAIGVPGRSSRG